MSEAVEVLIELPQFSTQFLERLHRRSSKPKMRCHHTVIKRRRRVLTRDDVITWVNRFDELPFSKLPSRLRLELRVHKIAFGPRIPTKHEQLESENDAIDHRRYTFTQTLDDLLNFYRRQPDHV